MVVKDLFSRHKLTGGALVAAYLVLLGACSQDVAPTPKPRPTPAPTSIFTPVPDRTLTPVIATPSPTEIPESFSLASLPRKTTLTISDVNPSTLDPALAIDHVSRNYISQIFGGLVKLDTNLDVAPNLAKSWDILGGGVRYVFHLDPKASFHSGRAVTSQDVKNSLERATDPKTGSGTARTYLGDILGVQRKLNGHAQEISGIRVVDEQTLEMLVDAPKPYVLAKLAYPVASVVDMDNVAGGPEWFRKPNGTGPFKLKAWEDEEFLVLERNQSHHIEVPHVEFVAFRFLSSEPIQSYKTDKIDAVTVGISSFKKTLDPQDPIRKDLLSFQNLTTSLIGFNVSKPPFDDQLVRRAFGLALDRESLVQVALGDSAGISQGFLPPEMSGYVTALHGTAYNPEQARQLLAKSKYGSPERLPNIVYTTFTDGSTENVTKAMADMWYTNLGVQITVRHIDADSYPERIANELDNLFHYKWVADYPDPENILDILFHSQGARNIGKYTSDLVDTLLEEARVEQVVQKRLNAYRQVQQLLLSDAAAIPLWHDHSYALVKPYVKGYKVTPQGIVSLTKVRLDR